MHSHNVKVKKFVSLIFAVRGKSTKSTKIMHLENYTVFITLSYWIQLQKYITPLRDEMRLYYHSMWDEICSCGLYQSRPGNHPSLKVVGKNELSKLITAHPVFRLMQLAIFYFLKWQYFLFITQSYWLQLQK